MNEEGSGVFEELISQASEIAVSPVTWLEVNAALERTVRKNYLSPEKSGEVRKEIKRDFDYFSVVIWDEALENKAVDLIRSHALKSMDAIQLASGILSEPDIFVTSDRQLHLAAKKMLRHTRLI